MKKSLSLLLLAAASLLPATAATINWSAGSNNGLSLADGTNLPAGSLVRLGYFRDAGTGVQLTDAQIQALATSPATLNNSFVEAGSATIGGGVGSVAGHFAAASATDTSSAGLNLAGKQIYVWVFNAGTLAAATQQAIFYAAISDTVTNPDATAETPGVRWSFPAQDPPGVTTVDLTDLTTGTTPLASSARVVVGTFSAGTSATTGAPNLGLSTFSTVLAITTASPLASGTQGAAYSQTLSAAAGTAPYTWNMAAGALPGSVTLSNAGVISGTPSATGTFNFTAQVTDSVSATDTKAFALTIYSAPSITTASPLPGGMVATAYSQTLAASGGLAPYTWTLNSGALPGGLALSSAGVLSGTPTAAGTFNFTVQLTDSVPASVTKAFALTIAPQPLSITTASPLTGGTLGAAYSQTLAASGGTGGYTWTMSAGALPAGITLNAAGSVSGTPTTSGAFNFTARVTDSASATTTQAFDLTISASGPLHHFTWDYVPAAANAGKPFGVRITARDVNNALVTSFNGSPALTAASSSGGTVGSPIVITEYTDEGEDQFEIQNISNATVNTTGWFVRIGDTQTNTVAGMNTLNATTFTLPASMTAGQVIRVTETNGIAGTSYFGGAIGWSSIPGNGRGWVMLMDNTSAVKDFFAAGWDATMLGSFSVIINGAAKTLTGQWTGAGGVVGTRGPGADMPGVTLDSFQRTGTSDTNVAANFTWRTGATGAPATSFGTTNTGLTVPWVSSTPLTVTPASVALSSGEFIGYLSISPAATGVTLTATSAAISGNSATMTIAAALTDTDGDGMPDTWESANGTNPAINDATGDLDGDGATNLVEYTAGTAANSAANSLRFIAPTSASAGQFTWPAIAGKIYRLRSTADLTTWQTTGPLQIATADGTLGMAVTTTGLPRLFVRVEILP